MGVFDLSCGAFSLLAVILWAVIASPQLAILCAIIGDIFASFPTLIKTWKYPDTETGAMFFVQSSQRAIGSALHSRLEYC